MDLEEVTRRLEEERESWRQNNQEWEKNKSGRVKFFKTNLTGRYIARVILLAATTTLLSYAGCRMVNSGSTIIDKYVDKLSAFYSEK